jgi:hypothetical protein
MKTRLLISFALAIGFLFLNPNYLFAQQDCGYEYSLRCPPSYDGCIDESQGSANTGFPTINRSGTLCDSVQFFYVDQISVEDDCNLLFDRLWSATIPGSNVTRKCSQRIQLFDDTSPQITSCPQDVTITLPDSIHFWTEPSVTDNCGTVSLSGSHTSGSLMDVATPAVVLSA